MMGKTGVQRAYHQPQKCWKPWGYPSPALQLTYQVPLKLTSNHHRSPWITMPLMFQTCLELQVAGLPKNLPRIFTQISQSCWIFMDFHGFSCARSALQRLGVEGQEGGHRHRGGIGEDLWGFLETLWKTKLAGGYCCGYSNAIRFVIVVHGD